MGQAARGPNAFTGDINWVEIDLADASLLESFGLPLELEPEPA